MGGVPTMLKIKISETNVLISTLEHFSLLLLLLVFHYEENVAVKFFFLQSIGNYQLLNRKTGISSSILST